MISPRSQGPQPTPESASQTMVWVPAGNPRLTGNRVPPGLQGNPMGPAEYHRRLQFRVQAMMDQAGPEETLMALEALVPEAAAALEDAYPVQVAEILFEMTDSLTRATLAEQLARVAWPVTPRAAAQGAEAAMAATGLRAWLRLAVPPEAAAEDAFSEAFGRAPPAKKTPSKRTPRANDAATFAVRNATSVADRA